MTGNLENFFNFGGNYTRPPPNLVTRRFAIRVQFKSGWTCMLCSQQTMRPETCMSVSASDDPLLSQPALKFIQHFQTVSNHQLYDYEAPLHGHRMNFPRTWGTRSVLKTAGQLDKLLAQLMTRSLGGHRSHVAWSCRNYSSTETAHGASSLRPCLVDPKNQKNFRIFRHIESSSTCIEH